jgi:hypothetical protein
MKLIITPKPNLIASTKPNIKQEQELQAQNELRELILNKNQLHQSNIQKSEETKSVKTNKQSNQAKNRIKALFAKWDIILIIMLISLLIGGDTWAVKSIANFDSYVKSQNIFVQEIIPLKNFKDLNTPSSAILNSQGANNPIFLGSDGKIRNDASIEASRSARSPRVYLSSEGTKTFNKIPKISDLIPAPYNPEKQNTLFYPRFGITANIVHLSREEYDIIYAGEPCSYRSINTPLQKRVRDGILHLYGSPTPGDIRYVGDPNHLTYDQTGKRYEQEIGTSYIVGHSSECTEHAYTKIFEPLVYKSKEGDEFFIWDAEGRKLKFKVFAAFKINDDDVKTAYKKYDERRVVTLQTSIYIDKNNIQRWLTLGDLVLD